MLYVFFGIPLLLLSAVLYVAWRIGRRPVGTSDTLRASEGQPVLLCLGDSITHGHIGANWVGDLRVHLAPSGRQVANAGVNGHMAYNVARRLDRELRCAPDMVVLFIGTNDVMAAQRRDRAEQYVKRNKLPRLPDLDWSISQLRALAARLVDVAPHVALCTIPPLGDDDQHEIAALVRRYNDVVRELATTYDFALLDVHEALQPLIGAGTQAYVGAPDAIQKLIARAGAAYYLRGRSWDAIAERMGFGATVDGIHLTETAGSRVRELVAEFVQRADAA